MGKPAGLLRAMVRRKAKTARPSGRLQEECNTRPGEPRRHQQPHMNTAGLHQHRRQRAKHRMPRRREGKGPSARQQGRKTGSVPGRNKTGSQALASAKRMNLGPQLRPNQRANPRREGINRTEAGTRGSISQVVSRTHPKGSKENVQLIACAHNVQQLGTAGPRARVEFAQHKDGRQVVTH